MTITVTPVPLAEVLPLRELYRQEMNCQIVHDSLPGRGFGNLFLLRLDGRIAGYGFVMGYRGEPKDMIQEFYVVPAPRGSALPMFRQLIEASGGQPIEVQSNDVLLTLMLYDCATEITSDRVVFHDALTTNLDDTRRHRPGGHRGGQGSDFRAQGGRRWRMADRAEWRDRRDRRDSPSLQSAVRRYLHGGRRAAPTARRMAATWFRSSSGSATRSAGYPRPGATPRTSAPGRHCKRPGSFRAARMLSGVGSIAVFNRVIRGTLPKSPARKPLRRLDFVLRAFRPRNPRTRRDGWRRGGDLAAIFS